MKIVVTGALGHINGEPIDVEIAFEQQTGIVNRAYPGYPPAGRIAPRLDWRVERA